MGYLDKRLMPQERIIYRAKLHWIIYPKSFLFLISAFLLPLFVSLPTLTALLLFLGVVFLVRAVIIWLTSEFGITNRRVLVKEGLIRRSSFETLIHKIEGISVDQSLLGRVLNFGTVIITGTGGSKEKLKAIASPLEFRRNVPSQLSA